MSHLLFTNPQAVVAHAEHCIQTKGQPQLAGLEEEIILLNRDGTLPQLAQVQQLVRAVARDFGGAVKAIDLLNGGVAAIEASLSIGSINVETNTGLLEFAHKPQTNSNMIADQSERFFASAQTAATALGMVLVAAGHLPHLTYRDFAPNGKASHAVVLARAFAYSVQHVTNQTRPEYLATVFGTASIHHNQGFNDAERLAKYFTATLFLQPSMIALLANAPYRNGVKGVHTSQRAIAQTEYGRIFGVSEPLDYLYHKGFCNLGLSFDGLVNTYLDIPMDRTVVNGQKQTAPNGMTMRDYLANGIDGHYPTEDALVFMVREPIVDVRPELFRAPRVETRAHDTNARPINVALDALYRGIANNLDDVRHMLKKVYPNDHELRFQRLRVCNDGLKTKLPNGQTQQELWKDLLLLSKQGLIKRQFRESSLLHPLEEIVDRGQNPAQTLFGRLPIYKWEQFMQLSSYDQPTARPKFEELRRVK